MIEQRIIYVPLLLLLLRLPPSGICSIYIYIHIHRADRRILFIRLVIRPHLVHFLYWSIFQPPGGNYYYRQCCMVDTLLSAGSWDIAFHAALTMFTSSLRSISLMHNSWAACKMQTIALRRQGVAETEQVKCVLRTKWLTSLRAFLQSSWVLRVC